MKYKLLTLLMLLFAMQLGAFNYISPNNGSRVEIEVPSQKGKMMYFINYWNGATYALDSITVSDQGKAIFSFKDELPAGQYMLYVKPNLQLDLLIDKGQNDIKLFIDEQNLSKSIVSGSKDTQHLWIYLSELQERKNKKEQLEKKLEDETIAATRKTAIQEEIKTIDAEADAFIKETVAKYKGSWFSTFIKGTEPIDYPIKDVKNNDDLAKNRKYIKDHYFDNVDLTDIRFWKTNYFVSQIDSYMEQWVEQVPDSLANAASKLVSKTTTNPSCFKEMLSKLTNHYIASPVMGSENVWMKLAEDYIFDKNISWIDSTQTSELKKLYEAAKLNRIGMQAQNLTLNDINNSIINTNEIEGKFIVLYFYDPNCGHCEKEVPAIYNELYKKYKDKGVKVVAINIGANKTQWENFINEHKLTDWSNCSDFEYKSQYWMYYDTTSIPSIYVLDENKKIIAKKLDKENLERFFKFYIDNKNGVN